MQKSVEAPPKRCTFYQDKSIRPWKSTNNKIQFCDGCERAFSKLILVGLGLVRFNVPLDT